MKISVIHQTDLFHPCEDPDDHWDLACQFALAFGGDIDLKGILIDYPPDIGYGDPSIQSVSQMNYITGLQVPVGIGTPKIRPKSRKEEIDLSNPIYGGVGMVLKLLEEADEPVVIHIVGSSRDIAAAGLLRPDLFREKCRAIYLNAGSSIDNGELEYNVKLDPLSYSVMFLLPCKIYWMPCFEKAPQLQASQFKMGTYGTYYSFRQEEVLPHLSENVQKYLFYALGKVMNTSWLSYLSEAKDKNLMDFHMPRERNMWSTAGFFHAAEKMVAKNGSIMEAGDVNTNPVFSYEPVEVSCDEDGVVRWNITDRETNRFIFRVNDLSCYRQALTVAMKTLLKRLP